MPVMNARIAFLVALSLLALLPSLSLQDREWISEDSSDQYEIVVNSTPSHSAWEENNDFFIGPTRRKDGGKESSDGSGGSSSRKLSGRNKEDTGTSTKHGNHTNKTTQRPSNNNRSTPRNNNGTIQRPSNNNGTIQRPSNNNGTTQRPPNNNQTTQRPPHHENQQCRDNEFHCGSNECLPRSVRCNNRIDCRDASDEQFCTENRNQDGGCVLPGQPEGGRYELNGCKRRCDKRPGDTVPKNSILNYTCKSNYILKGNTISICVDDKWYLLPSCQKVCSPLNSTSVDISCSYQGKTVSCSERIMPGTRATLACKSSYKLSLTNDPAYREITCLDDGLWDRRLFRCLPECGTIAHDETLINESTNEFPAKARIFPWHVGIYAKKNTEEYQQICGGSLISNNLVVSVAHCFYDEVYGKLYNSSKYAVAVGKYYHNWNTSERYAQHSLIESIQVSERYQGARGNFAEDVALLKLKTPFELTTLVKPVCIDWDNTYESEQLQVGQVGKMVGWSKSITEESKSLQEINMSFVPYNQCLSAVPVNFRGFLTPDKFCADHLNGSNVCDGDSGGLCFQKDNVWYLRGIVSVSPENKGTCDYNSYVGFTYISHFRDWIREAFVNS